MKIAKKFKARAGKLVPDPGLNFSAEVSDEAVKDA